MLRLRSSADSKANQAALVNKWIDPAKEWKQEYNIWKEIQAYKRAFAVERDQNQIIVCNLSYIYSEDYRIYRRKKNAASHSHRTMENPPPWRPRNAIYQRNESIVVGTNKIRERESPHLLLLTKGFIKVSISMRRKKRMLQAGGNAGPHPTRTSFMQVWLLFLPLWLAMFGILGRTPLIQE